MLLRAGMLVSFLSAWPIAGTFAQGQIGADTQTQSTTGTTQTQGAPEIKKTSTTSCTDETQVKITDAYKRPAASDAPVDRNVQLGDTIVLKVNCLAAYTRQYENPKKNIVLFIDGRPLPDVAAYPPTDPQNGELNFELKRMETSRDVWTYVLGEPFNNGTRRKIKVSAGVADQFEIPINSIVPPLILDTVPTAPLIIWCTVLIFLITTLFLAAFRSDLLRDPVPQP